MTDEQWMQEAIKLAKQASDAGEVPVGAIVVCNDEIVGTGRNRREFGKNALCHAELEAIDAACRKLGGWRLWHCSLYVTLEPCMMCAGAIVNAHIPKVVFGASDAKNGAAGSIVNLFRLPNQQHPEYQGGVLEQECAALLQRFFAELRQKRAAEPKRWQKGR